MGIKRIKRNYYQVRVYGTDRRTLPSRKVERARWVHGSFAEAKRQHVEMQEALEAELSGRGEQMTLTAYVARWLEARVGELAPSTTAKYVNDLERYILPSLGAFRLDALRPTNVQAMLSSDPGAPNSKRNRLMLLRKLSKDAIRDQLIDRDFCFGLSVRVPPVYSEIEPNCLPGPMMDKVLHAIPPYWRDVALMLGFTGLRWGEVSALHWPEIDLANKLAVVRWSNWKGCLKAPKTARALRQIPLAGPLPAMLGERERQMAADQGQARASGLAFPTRTGGLHKGTPLNRVLRKACDEVGVSIRFTPHGMRRTWNDQGRRLTSGTVIRSLVGHASDAMTDHYSNVGLTEKRDAAEAIAAEVRGEDSEKSSEATGAEAGAEESGDSRESGVLSGVGRSEGPVDPPKTE